MLIVSFKLACTPQLAMPVGDVSLGAWFVACLFVPGAIASRLTMARLAPQT